MRRFADEENFEVALNYRNKLKVLAKIVQKQVSALPKDFNLDIFAFETNGIICAVNMLVVRAGKLVGGENFTTGCADEDIASYIYQYYTNNPPLCDEIVTDGASAPESLEEAVNKFCVHTVRVVEPKQGVRKQLLELAHSNAYDAMVKHGTQDERRELRTLGAVRQLAELLKLRALPNRIEGYDISHISGTDKVASMVVFEGGQPKKAHYRKFKIKTVEGNNDFACMREVLTRRLERLGGDDESFSAIPDLLLIDGGKGQLAYAKEAQSITGREDIEIISLAKREEEVFTLNSDESVKIPHRDYALKMLQRIRDEAHRFAITYFRNLHSKRNLDSVLSEIDGVGKKKRIALMEKFGTLDKIIGADTDELANTDGIGPKLAEKIKNYFQENL